MERTHLRLVTAALAIFLPMAIVATAFRAAKRQLYEEQLKSAAQLSAKTAESVVLYLSRIVQDVELLASVPTVRDAVIRANSRRYDAEEVRRIDADYKIGTRTFRPESEAADSFLGRIVDPAGPRSEAAGGYREILLADAYGRLAAAPAPTEDYDQSDEPWWRRATNENRANLGDIYLDPSAQAWGIPVAAPVRDLESGEAIGALKALVAPQELLAFLTAITWSAHSDVFLLKWSEDATSEGTASGGAKIILRSDVTGEPFAEEVLSFLDLPKTRENTSFSAERDDGDGRRYVIGVNYNVINDFDRELPWFVAVAQPLTPLLAPLRRTVLYWLFFGSVAFLAFVSYVFYSFTSKRIAAEDRSG